MLDQLSELKVTLLEEGFHILEGSFMEKGVRCIDTKLQRMQDSLICFTGHAVIPASLYGDEEHIYLIMEAKHDIEEAEHVRNTTDPKTCKHLTVVIDGKVFCSKCRAKLGVIIQPSFSQN